MLSFLKTPPDKDGKRISLILLLIASLVVSFACKPGRHLAAHPKPAMDAGLPRISPAYVQWLVQQSMLGEAKKLIGEVSGTTRVWQNSGTEERFSLLLKAAPNWLDVNPHAEKSLQPALRALAAPSLLAELRQSGLQGIFLAPTGETGDIWAKVPARESLGEDITAFTFCREAGDDKAFAQFLQATSQANIEIGGNLPQAATGLGPDFMLQARGLTSYEGLYAAVEIPREYWPLLPKAHSEWQINRLSEEAHKKLAEAGLLPQHLHKDRTVWTEPATWAVTGSVQGIDGSQRRWVYAFAGDKKRPILFWQDPSGHAKRLFSAAAIRHTGFQQHALTGLPFKALMGLDALGPMETNEDVSLDLEPGLSALGELSQAVHRYGGWSLFPETLPAPVLPLLLRKVDFVKDSITPLAVCYALLTEDTTPLKDMISLSFKLHIPHSRLAHGLNAWKGEDVRSLRALPQMHKLSSRFAETDSFLQTRPMSWPKNIPAEETKRLSLLEMAIPLGMPGLFFVSPPELRLQQTSKASLVSAETTLSRLLQARHLLGLAQAQLTPPLAAPHGCLLLKNQLPTGGLWITAANFSRKEHDLQLPLRQAQELAIYDLCTHAPAKEITKRTDSITLRLPPRQARHVYIDKAETVRLHFSKTRVEGNLTTAN